MGAEPKVHHTLVFARPERVQALAERLPDVARAPGELERLAWRWNEEDRRDEHADSIRMDAAARAEITAGIDLALQTVRAAARDRGPGGLDPELHALPGGLSAERELIPLRMPRADLVRIRRSVARLRRLGDLSAPELFLWNEAKLLCVLLADARREPTERPFDLEARGADEMRGLVDVLVMRALDLCVLREPGATGGKNLGLGAAVTEARTLALQGGDLMALHDAWERDHDRDHPWGRYPWVPERWMLPVAGVRAVEGVGPVGWAAGASLERLAHDLRGLAEDEPRLVRPIADLAGKLDAAGPSAACIACLELLPPEADGAPTFLVAEDDDA